MTDVRCSIWAELAATATDAELREKILTGFKDGKPFTPYVPTLALPSPLESVLDFGCGLGRNFPYLTTIATRVTGYDLPEMIDRCRRVSPVSVDLLSSDWDEVRGTRFGMVFASLVLQHVPEYVCRQALDGFAAMAPVTYLLARGQGDFGFSALELVARSQKFDTGACRIVDHDPVSHQLRVLGSVPFDAARSADDPRHFEVVLRSRVYRS
jgi:hypothetical protein